MFLTGRTTRCVHPQDNQLGLAQDTIRSMSGLVPIATDKNFFSKRVCMFESFLFQY